MSPRKLVILLVLLLSMTLTLAACELPFPGGDSPTATPDPNVGGGTDGTPQPTPESSDQTQPTPEPESQAQPTPEPTTAAVEQVKPTAETSSSQPTPTATATSVPPTPGGGTVGIPPTQEVIHIVQPGENLFRIGLQYGYSWVVLAQHNGIPNPHFVVVGQQIRIPPAGGSGGTGGQPPGGIYTNYVVQPGDNLFRIGLQFGMSWVLIAEANGIANPNFIVPGQVLKIPIIS